MSSRATMIGVFVAGMAALGGAGLYLIDGSDTSDANVSYSGPDGAALTADMAHQQYFQLTPALLLVVYDAFGKTGEDEIYDTLERVTHDEALEYLYLERVGAMAGGGLEEADQTIHEISLLGAEVQRSGATLEVDATWQVIGTVGHAEHMHVRGNTYSAELTVAPVDGAWRITSFELLDVDRNSAGETFLAPQTN